MGCSFERQKRYGITNTNSFQETNESGCKPNKIWLDEVREFYIRSMKSWLESNDVEMYLTHNERKSVIAERLVRTLQNKIGKYITLVSKNVYIDKFHDTANKS